MRDDSTSRRPRLRGYYGMGNLQLMIRRRGEEKDPAPFNSVRRVRALGTRTATLDRHGIAKLRQNWVYRLNQ
jgi:hypothetical protein